MVGLRGPGLGWGELPSPFQVCIGAFPNVAASGQWVAPLGQELCFYTMSKTPWAAAAAAAAALVGYTSEAVRPEISSTFTVNDFQNSLKAGS